MLVHVYVYIYAYTMNLQSSFFEIIYHQKNETSLFIKKHYVSKIKYLNKY